MAEDDIGYPTVNAEWRGEEWATRPICTWVKDGFERYAGRVHPTGELLAAPLLLPPFTPPGMPQREPVDPWPELMVASALWMWIVVVSRDDAVVRMYGQTTQPGDWQYRLLQDEAKRFLFYLLGKYQHYDDAAVETEAADFWKWLTSQSETYEVGTPIHHLDLTTERDRLPMGPGIEFRRIEGEWAAERFEHGDAIPRGYWALSVQVTREREQQQERFFGSSATERLERTLIQRGLIPMRLMGLRPIGLTDPSYRIVGPGAHWHKLRRVPYREGSWRMFERPGSRGSFNAEWTQEFAGLGARLSRRVPSQRVVHVEQEDSDYLELALRAFSSSANRDAWQDTIVDLAVALEALLADGTEGLSYKVAMRAGLLLGQDSTAAWRVFSAVREFYNLRSKIVHGVGPSEYSNAAKRFVVAWEGSAEGTPPRDNRRRATGIASQLIGALLRGCVHLDAAGVLEFAKSKGGKQYVSVLDRLAFDEQRRGEVQTTAGVRQRVK